MCRWYSVAFLFVALTASASDTANLTGTWRLNVTKSTWGTRPRPASVTLHIEHKEPALTYSGMVIYSGEDMRPFSFTGAIDAKPYPMDRSYGTGTAVLRRIDATTFESVFRSADGSVETTRTSITRSGQTLTRRIRLEPPGGGPTSTSVEVYDRQ